MKFQNNSIGNRRAFTDDKMSNIRNLPFEWKVDLIYIIRNSDTSLAGLVQLKIGKNLFTETFK